MAGYDLWRHSTEGISYSLDVPSAYREKHFHFQVNSMFITLILPPGVSNLTLRTVIGQMSACWPREKVNFVTE